MKIARITTDEKGETHFRDDEIALSPKDFAPPAPPLNVSTPAPAARIVFLGAPAGWLGDWHPAPCRQYWVGISGELEVTVSDGESRRFGPGSVVLLEDTTGRGHVTRALGGAPAEGLFVQAPPDPTDD